MSQDLIVDDLKSVVLAKFPTSLQRTTDPADLSIRLPISAQPPPSRLSNSHLQHAHAPSSPAMAAAAAATEEYRTATPHHTSFTLALRKKQPTKPSPLTIKTPGQQQATASTAASSSATSPHPLGEALAPDANVWQLLDAHFPQGMRMDDALVIEGETTQPTQQQHHHVGSSQVVKQVVVPHHNVHQPHLQTPGYPTSAQLNSDSSFTGPPSATDEDALYEDDLKTGSRKRKEISAVAGAAGASSGSPVQTASQSPAAAGTAPGGVLLLPRQFRGGTRNSDKEPRDGAGRKKGTSPAPDEKRRQQHSAATPAPTVPAATATPDAHQPVAKAPRTEATNGTAPAEPPKPTISITARPNGATITESPSNTNLHMLGKQKKDEKMVVRKEVRHPSGPTDTKIEARTEVKPEKTLPPQLPDPRRTRTPIQEKIKNKQDPTTMETIVPRVNVLIVEDNEINQKILEAFMRKRKIRSSVAKNGREALEKWRQGGFHLILMDIQLPVMSGILVTKEIRRLEHQNKIGVFSGTSGSIGAVAKEDILEPNLFRSPVIIVALTASSLKEDKSEALAAGCNDFLTKPVNMVWLERKIMEWGCMQALIDFEGWKMWRGRDFDANHTPAIGRALANTHLVQPVAATRSRSRSNSRLVRQNSANGGARSKLSMTPADAAQRRAATTPGATNVTSPGAGSAAAPGAASKPASAHSEPVKPQTETYRVEPPQTVEVPAK